MIITTTISSYKVWYYFAFKIVNAKYIYCKISELYTILLSTIGLMNIKYYFLGMLTQLVLT